MTRRSALKALGALTAVGSLGGLACLEKGKATLKDRAPGTCMRIAHLTDVHVQPENTSEQGLVRCLHHIQSIPDAPELILNGGDAIADAFHTETSSASQQWALWDRVLRAECSLPVEHCLGNHDVSPTNGKQRALDAFGLTQRYRSFDRGGWHFVVLDSVFIREGTYEARLDEDQFQWLKKDLAAVKKSTPILVLSHIPILSVCAYFDGDNEKSGQWRIPGGWVHVDARRVKDLFREQGNVKLCLSGHIHLRDRVEYEGITYICDGAVSGNWWSGPYQGCEPGYGLIDLHSDGRFDYQFATYG